VDIFHAPMSVQPTIQPTITATTAPVGIGGPKWRARSLRNTVRNFLVVDHVCSGMTGVVASEALRQGGTAPNRTFNGTRRTK
jgi:hypothetical protein